MPRGLTNLQDGALSPGSFLYSLEVGKPSKLADVDMTESTGLTNLKATPLQVLITPRLDSKLYELQKQNYSKEAAHATRDKQAAAVAYECCPNSTYFVALTAPVFNGEGYHIWVVKMRTYLQAFDLWEVVNTDAEPTPLRANPTVAQIRQHADERTKRHKAMSCIQNCVSDVIFTRIMVCETPKQAWDKLKKEFQGTERTRQQQLLNLRRDFENLKMKEEETVKQYSDSIMAVVNSIRLFGEQFNEARIMEKVLSTLPERYEAKISSLEDSRNKEGLAEWRSTEGAFQAKTKSASSTSAYKGKKTWKNRPKPDAARRRDQSCKHCKRPGHSEERCWFRPDAQYQHCKKMGYVESSDHEEQVFAVSCSASQKNGSKGWLLDSGCTNHMSPDPTIFKTSDRSCKTKVKVGNGQFIKAEGKGNVLICTPTGDKVISNVLLAPEIDRNLLSIAQLLEKGYSVVFKGKECQIANSNGSSFMSVTMTDKCFKVNWPSDSHSACIASTEDSKLWHQRLGHANFRSMAQMVSEKLVGNFTNSVKDNDVCEVCQLRKQARLPFPTNKAWRASEKLQLVHTDVCGPMKTESLNGNRLPTKALAHKTPFEAWFGFKPSLAHLKVFGCLSYAHTPTVKRDKLSKMAQPGILVGYSSVKKGYRILDPSTNKIPKAISEELMVDQAKPNQIGPEMDTDDMPVRGTRLLAEIYERAHLDVKSTFLNGFLEEEIYIDQPQGFVLSGKEHMVYRLKKALYGLKQAPRACEPTLYVKKNEAETQLIVSLYVDDLLVTGGDNNILADFKAKIKDMFEMSDLELMTYFLGMGVCQAEGGIFLGQKTFALKVLSKFSMENCKQTSTPMAFRVKLSSQGVHEQVSEPTYSSLVGCLLYLTATRPDIMFAVSISRFMHCCNEQHFQAAKRVLRYIKGTLGYGVLFNKAESLKLIGYIDSDWAGSSDDMKTTSGYAFTLGSGMFCWSSRKQNLVAQSTAEAEYVAVAAVNQAIWLRKILADLNLHQTEATEIYCDNKSTVAIAKNPIFHGRTKHFSIKLHVIREIEQAHEVELVHCNSEKQITDIFTKALNVSRFIKLRKQLGVTSMETKEEC
ncbi:Integrase, catalytic core [Gossypium australe]|uniref:Integrase, catalytic core n=1 Tax=Gossypium australe TaxID=47621 RepID=A0A5B6VZH4_9ROSI|nr:Integrase, catalytic core [Gossypium australe]